MRIEGSFGFFLIQNKLLYFNEMSTFNWMCLPAYI